jgi:two-component system LytT family sensor kinase
MRWANDKIGFDDRLVIVLGILGFSVMVPVVFFNWHIWEPPYLPWQAFWPCFLITATIWLGCRYIMVWSRKRYPRFADVRRRLWVQNSLILLYALVANNGIGTLTDGICEPLIKLRAHPRSATDILVGSNAAAILCTVLVVAIYESIYFINELRKSVIEKEQLKRDTLQAQLNALRIQVNPHFLFNNLNTLSAVIPDNPSQAVDFVQQLSKVYRHILEVKDEQSILLKEELEVLESYAFLMKTRFGENLDISIRVAEEKLHQRIVPLSLQILMENAIKHNIVSSAKPLHIDISTEEGRLIVKNTLQKKNQSMESTGIGLDNIRNRYRLLGNRVVEVAEGPGSFTVAIPLM